MICTNQTEARRIARFTADRMTDEGYKAIPLQKMLPADLQNVFRVENKTKGVSYVVNVTGKTCTCKFFAENAKYKVCKHIFFGIDEKAKDVAEAAYQAAEKARMEWLEAQHEAQTEGRALAREEYLDALEQGR